MLKQKKSTNLVALQSKTNELIKRMEKLNLAEYVEMLRDPKRLLWTNFLAGAARGIGMAVGFTLLGALVIYLLQRVVLLNLPGISNFLADIIRMVQEQS
ncbi:DUF5665 domain-containing protein [Bacillota bacterium LX-D]|nr:DUF5665 domain-containing protein [Bacillota bacterium LX-D]